MDDPQENLPPVVAAPAVASTGTGPVDQTQTASAAAPSAGAAVDLPLMQPAAAAASAGDAASSGAGGHGFRLFDIQILQNLVANRNWDNLEKQLKEFVSVKEGVDPVREHPYIFIPVYEAWIIDLIKRQEHGSALKLFSDKVAVLYYDIKSDFVNEKDLKQQVNRLHEIANLNAAAKDASVENIQAALTDYIYLYFPLYRPDRQADRPSHLWRFAKMVRKPHGQKDPNFKCLACGELFKNCTISKMRDHLDIKSGGKTCPKLTRNLQLRFEEGERQKAPKHHGPGESSLPSRHGKVGKAAAQNLVIQEKPGPGESSLPSRHGKVGKTAAQSLVIQEKPGPGESSLPSRHGKIEKTSTQNVAIQEKTPAASEGTTNNTLVAKLVEVAHANATSLHITSAGKPLEPRVEEQLRAARDLLSEVLSQKSKHT